MVFSYTSSCVEFSPKTKSYSYVISFNFKILICSPAKNIPLISSGIYSVGIDNFIISFSGTDIVLKFESSCSDFDKGLVRTATSMLFLENLDDNDWSFIGLFGDWELLGVFLMFLSFLFFCLNER